MCHELCQPLNTICGECTKCKLANAFKPVPVTHCSRIHSLAKSSPQTLEHVSFRQDFSQLSFFLWLEGHGAVTLNVAAALFSNVSN